MSTFPQEIKDDFKVLVSPSDKTQAEEERKVKFGFPSSNVNAYTVSDCRALVKTLICCVKTITCGFSSLKGEIPIQNKQFQVSINAILIVVLSHSV